MDTTQSWRKILLQGTSRYLPTALANKAKENYDDDKDLDNGDDGDLDDLDDDGGGLTDSGRAGCDQGRPMRCCP